MLILTRKPGQAFRIGSDICISVVETTGDKVRIGIEAPRDICILREELVQTTDMNQQAAAGADMSTLRSMAANLKKRSVMTEAQIKDIVPKE